ncbi:MAG: hydrogenase maturation protease [Firmicutes bacterium]|nr:hydrogenase maturation protease [Bacillota bacterium]
MKRIICIGNRLVPEDSAGPAVYDLLKQQELPLDIEAIDGGVAGLNLLRFVEGAECVVFVDKVNGFGKPNEVVILESAEASTAAENTHSHSAGLPYLLRIIPEVCEGKIPHISLVGIEGHPNEALIDEAAAIALKIAGDGKSSHITGF